MSSRTTAPFGFLRVGAACPRLALADPEGNVTEMLRLHGAARERGVQVLLFPELSLTGYTASDLFFSLATLVAGVERAVERLLRETAKSPMVIVAGMPLAQEGRLFNTAAVMQGGKVLGLVPKSYIPGYKEYYEERWFSPARDAMSDTARFLGESVPFSADLLFTLESEPWVLRSARTSGPRCPRAASTPSPGPP
jgi:NAD+ synthase (glutamine-hydrolysing)